MAGRDGAIIVTRRAAAKSVVLITGGMDEGKEEPTATDELATGKVPPERKNSTTVPVFLGQRTEPLRSIEQRGASVQTLIESPARPKASYAPARKRSFFGNMDQCAGSVAPFAVDRPLWQRTALE